MNDKNQTIINFSKKFDLSYCVYNVLYDKTNYRYKLTDKDGKFNKDYTNDGLHPNALGYAKITRVLMPYIIETDNTKA